ncbi:hemerythrin family protein [Sporomusa sp.]|uniref:bacteriohemerythrin n=1 Tax=Sporomusa sp. TaxID=2078658 RepID=UPI002C77B9F1|nr:hemerythrin family protein [Sporomusa sp.]HWR44838.1 hemerythrin family protein [Sporomusa sp.]
MMWKEKYKIGIQIIDEQHEELFYRVSKFVKLLHQEDPWQEKLSQIKETMEFMQSYVIIHFDYEEAYQKEINYPNHEGHRKIHEDFKREIGKYAETFATEGYNEELVQQLGGKLMAWLINHVVADDLKMAQYIGQEAGKS